MKKLIVMWVVVAVTTVSTIGVSASMPVEQILQPLSGSSPFRLPDGTMPECSKDVNDPLWGPIPDYEYEPTLAVDPSDPSHLVAVWLADDSIGVGFATSFDGGASWKSGVVPKITKCSGGEHRNVMDVRVAIAPPTPAHSMGVVYVASHPMAQPCPDPRCRQSQILVSRSLDGGLSYSAPVIIDDENVDFPIIAVDPSVPETAFISWSEITDFGLRVMFSSTSDGGEAWTSPIAIREAPGMIGGAQIVATPNTLYAVYQDVSRQELETARLLEQPTPGMSVRVLRSDDRGVSWHDMGIAATTADHWPVAPSASPDGSLYLAWPNRTDDGSMLMLTRSSDQAASWSEPIAIADDAFLPALASLPNGDIGVLYLDQRHDAMSGDEEATTDVWLAQFSNGLAQFQDKHLAGPFDASKVLFLGDHVSLAAYKCTFAGVFPLMAPYETQGLSDVYFGRLTLSPMNCPGRRAGVK